MDGLQNKQHLEVKRILINLSWTHKIQVKQADIYLKKKKNLNIIKIVLSAVTSSGIFTDIFVNKDIIKIATALVSCALLTITSLDKTSNYEQMHTRIKDDSNLLWELREKALSLLYAITFNTLSVEESQVKINELYKERNELYSHLLPSSNKAVKDAKAAIYETRDNNYEQEEKLLIPYELITIKENKDVSK